MKIAETKKGSVTTEWDDVRNIFVLQPIPLNCVNDFDSNEHIWDFRYYEANRHTCIQADKLRWVRETKRYTVPKKGAQPLKIEDNFQRLTKCWKNETKGYSLAASKINNNYYLAIIGLGVSLDKDKIVKLILEDLEKSSSYWHYALKKITGRNPVPKGLDHNTQKTREIWLQWGYESGILQK